MTQTTEIGGYEILAELKSGGMGDVYVARRRSAHGFAKLVALKTIRRDRVDNPDARAMFLDEAKLVARLDHPTIAQVHDFGEEDGNLYLAMEYVAGLSFNELPEEWTMPAGVAVRAIAEVCRGLHAAHEAVGLDGESLGVVHRDVSPHNLMLTFDGNIKILDFGIARTIDRVGPETQTGMLKGKPAYMAPEQMANSKVDRRADVFSTSVVLYELLTGEPLFAADNIFALADKVRGAPIPPPSERTAGIPEGLDAVVLRGLARDAGQRYPSTAAMAADLDAIATATAAESLASYAERALGAARTTHRELLQGLVAGEGQSVTTGPVGRARDVATLASSDEQMVTDTHIRNTQQAVAAAGLGRKRWLAWGTATVLLAGASVSGLVLSGRWPPSPEPPAPASVATTPVVEPAPTVVEPPIEVEPEAPAPEPVSKKIKRKKRRRPRVESKTATTPEVVEPPPAVVGYGFVKVIATPYANVRIDGKPAGPTPLMRHRVPTGEHRVELLDPETGAVRLSRTVTVRTDGLTTVKTP